MVPAAVLAISRFLLLSLAVSGSAVCLLPIVDFASMLPGFTSLLCAIGCGWTFNAESPTSPNPDTIAFVAVAVALVVAAGASALNSGNLVGGRSPLGFLIVCGSIACERRVRNNLLVCFVYFGWSSSRATYRIAQTLHLASELYHRAI